MGKLVTIVGSSGSGKTTLARAICQSPRYTPFLEDLKIRPFQASFMSQLKGYAFPNQVDFLLYRAEQEHFIRTNDVIGIQDGGLELDFYIFSRLFLENGYLTQAEFDLVGRLYALLRAILPPPDCVIKLNLPLEVLAQRRNERRRDLDITVNPDLARVDRLLQEWFDENPPSSPVLEVDYREDDFMFSRSIAQVLDFIQQHT